MADQEENPVVWRSDMKPENEPTINSVAIHARDFIKEVDDGLLYIMHVVGVFSTNPYHLSLGFMYSIRSKYESCHSMRNGPVVFGSRKDSYDLVIALAEKNGRSM